MAGDARRGLKLSRLCLHQLANLWLNGLGCSSGFDIPGCSGYGGRRGGGMVPFGGRFLVVEPGERFLPRRDERVSGVNGTRATQASSPIDHASPAPTDVGALLKG